MSKYPNNKCGSCEGCWYKKVSQMPDTVSVQEGKCPLYVPVELKVGRTITFKHWGDEGIITGKITNIEGERIDLDSTWFTMRHSLYEYMNMAYDELLKD